MKDEIIDCLAYNGKVSIKCISSRKIVEKARKLHDLSPTASAALGRLLTITSIMGYELKTEEASITNQIKGNGPIGILTAVADSNGNVKGYKYQQEKNPCGQFLAPLNSGRKKIERHNCHRQKPGIQFGIACIY